MEKLPKFGKDFEAYGKVCAVSLLVCGQASPSYMNRAKDVNWFSFGSNFVEVTVHPAVLFELRKNKIRSKI